MSGPAQTPAQFLNGGAAAKFSEKCVQELLKARYTPEQFGSHSYVKERCNQARKRLAQEAAHKKNPKSPAPKPPITAQERHEAKCEAAHISQNAVHENSRGNQCTDGHSDGYDTSLAPCMPQESSRMGGGPNSDHDVCTQMEIDKNAEMRRNRKDGGKFGSKMPYPDPPRGDHERERLRAIADDPDAQKRRGKKPIKRAEYTQPSGPPDSAPAAKPGEADQYKDASFNQPIDGNTAAECIDAFKQAAMDAMKADCAAKTAENQTAAYGRPKKPGESQEDYEKDTRAWREQKTKEFTAAKKAKKAATQEQTKTTNALKRAEEEHKQNPTPASAAALRQAKKDSRAARKANEKATEAVDAAFHAAPNVTKKYKKMRSNAAQAKCRAAQGERLQNDEGRDVSRVPNVKPDPPPGSTPSGGTP